MAEKISKSSAYHQKELLLSSINAKKQKIESGFKTMAIENSILEDDFDNVKEGIFKILDDLYEKVSNLTFEG